MRPGTAEREAALVIVGRLAPRQRISLEADKRCDVAGFIAALRIRRATPHVAVDDRISKLGSRRASAVDQRTMRHAVYAASQRVRKQIEDVFGWNKSLAGLRQT